MAVLAHQALYQKCLVRSPLSSQTQKVSTEKYCFGAFYGQGRSKSCLYPPQAHLIFWPGHLVGLPAGYAMTEQTRDSAQRGNLLSILLILPQPQKHHSIREGICAGGPSELPHNRKCRTCCWRKPGQPHELPSLVTSCFCVCRLIEGAVQSHEPSLLICLQGSQGQPRD